jgi:penicillin-insensitive murein endopeptidase
MARCLLPLFLFVALALPLELLACESRSTGYPDAGKLQGGVQLSGRNAPLRLQSFTLVYDYRWGTCKLVHGLQELARSVQGKIGRQPLLIGNLSQKGGGEMPVSTSHESGRDVDFPLFTMSASGRPLSGYYLHFGPDGRSRTHGGRYVFDAARTWQLVQAIVTSPHWEVERLVLAPYLRAQVLAHGKQANTPRDILQLVESKLIPPWPGVKLHDNHLHLRITCSAEDAAQGCLDRPLPQRTLVGEQPPVRAQP